MYIIYIVILDAILDHECKDENIVCRIETVEDKEFEICECKDDEQDNEDCKQDQIVCTIETDANGIEVEKCEC